MPEDTPFNTVPLDTLSFLHLKSCDQRAHPLNPNIIEDYNPKTNQFEPANKCDKQELLVIQDQYRHEYAINSSIQARPQQVFEIDRDPIHNFREDIDSMFFDATIPFAK